MTDLETAIRPYALRDYLGQEDIKTQLAIYIQAAKQRQEALDHVLLFGPPGLGKTTLSHIIAHEMGANVHQTSGPVLEKAGDLAALLMSLQPHDVLFIDEIHRLHPSIEEVLYPAMEDGRIDILVGDGADKKAITLPLPPFTLVAATTRSGSLSAPLRDRFGIVHRLQYYTPEELAQIIQRSASIWSIPLDEQSALNLAKRSRGTPRIANRLVRRVRDVAQIHYQTITPQAVDHALQLLGVDEHGLDELDQKTLRVLIDHFGGGPVGVDSLSAALSEERATLEEVVEPYLIQQGFLQRTARGRQVTDKARALFAQPKAVP